MKLVVVKWHDAGSAATEKEASTIFRESVGFQTKRNRKGIWLSMESDALSGIHFVPRGMILSVEVLARAKPPAKTIVNAGGEFETKV